MSSKTVDIIIAGIPYRMYIEYNVALDINDRIDIRVIRTSIGGVDLRLPREALSDFARGVATEICHAPWFQYAGADDGGEAPDATH